MFEPHTTPEQSGGQIHDMANGLADCIKRSRRLIAERDAKIAELEHHVKIQGEFIECVCDSLGMTAPYDNEEAMLIAHNLRAENDRLRVALWSIYEDDQHPNHKDPITPIIGKAGKIAWRALHPTKNGGNGK